MPVFKWCQCWYSFSDDSLPRCQGHTNLLCMCLFVYFWKLEMIYPWLAWCSLLWQDIKLCGKPCYSRAVPQINLSCCLPDHSPQFGSNKSLLYYYCRFLTNYYLKNFIYSFINFWLCWVFVAACGLSLVLGSRGYSLVVVHRLLTVLASLEPCPGQALEWAGFSSCGMWI